MKRFPLFAVPVLSLFMLTACGESPTEADTDELDLPVAQSQVFDRDVNGIIAQTTDADREVCRIVIPADDPGDWRRAGQDMVRFSSSNSSFIYFNAITGQVLVGSGADATIIFRGEPYPVGNGFFQFPDAHITLSYEGPQGTVSCRRHKQNDTVVVNEVVFTPAAE